MRSTIPPAANQPLGTVGDPPTIKKNAEKRELLLRLSISVFIFSSLFFGWQPAPASAAITRVQSKIVYEDPTASPHTITVTLDSAITEGNLIYTAVSIDKDSGAITPPSGYTLIHDFIGDSSEGESIASAFKVAGPSESTSITWNWVTNTSRGAQAAAVEYSGLATSSPLDVKAEAASGTTAVTSQTTGTTATTSQADELAIAIMGADSNGNVEVGRSWTNGFTEFLWFTNPPSGNPGLSVADKILSATGTQESTFSTTSGGDQMAEHSNLQGGCCNLRYDTDDVYNRRDTDIHRSCRLRHNYCGGMGRRRWRARYRCGRRRRCRKRRYQGFRFC